MKPIIISNNPLKQMRQFIRVNGLYMFACGLRRRAGIVFRQWMLARKLGCSDIVLGPRCHLRGLAYIHIGKSFQADEGLWLEAIAAYRGQFFSPSIVIGDNVSISRWSHITATHRVEIGDGVLIGSKVLITDHNHGQYSKEHASPHTAPASRPLDHDRKVIISPNVWLCDGVVVTPGSSIGEGTVVGANSVVKGSLPPFSMAEGSPAMVYRTFDFNTNKWINVK